MLKYFYFFSIFASITFANTNFAILYKVEKGDKKLGYYKTQVLDDTISSYSYGASNRLKMFSSKNITFIEPGYKKVVFSKGKQHIKFDVYTKLSPVNKKLQKQFARKFKKVKSDEMLFIRKYGKTGIELFNKRKTIIKTFDELLIDIYQDRVNYNKFILFDKLGVMKMVASLRREENTIIIRNFSKKKDYMQITIVNKVPTSIKSLLSNWSATAVIQGKVQTYDVAFKEILAHNLHYQLVAQLQDANIVFSRAKKVKSFYDLKGSISLNVPKEIADMKSYKQKEYFSNLLKKSKIKFRKVSLKNGVLKTEFKFKVKTLKLKKEILENLSTKYPELKMTKDIKFNKNNIVYGVINGQ